LFVFYQDVTLEEFFRQAMSRERRCMRYCKFSRKGMAEKLPRGFSYTWDLAFIGQISEAYTAYAVVAQVCMRATADFAAVVAAGRELWLSLLL